MDEGCCCDSHVVDYCLAEVASGSREDEALRGGRKRFLASLRGIITSAGATADLWVHVTQIHHHG